MPFSDCPDWKNMNQSSDTKKGLSDSQDAPVKEKRDKELRSSQSH